MRTQSKAVTFLTTLTLAFAGVVQLAAAQAGAGSNPKEPDPDPAVKIFDIPAQAANTALNEFAKQADITLVFSSDLVSGAQTRALRGSYSIAQALEQLLEGTRLSYQQLSEKTVAINNWEAERVTANKNVRRNTPRVVKNESSSRVSSADAPDSEEQDRATPGAGSKGFSEEIVVTAQKRAERLQDVPISMSVLDGERLDRSSFEGVREALNTVPGVSIVTNQNESPQVSVRGVSAAVTRFAGSGVVGYYLDTVPFALISSAIIPDSNAYDLERVEVLRGPQGTLYGASSLNGVMRVLTKEADLDEFQFKGRAMTSSTQDGGSNYRGDMAVNVPIVEGKLAARLVAGYQDMGGWIERPNHKDANSGMNRNLRAKINAQPTEALSIGLTAWRSRISRDATSVSAEDGRNPTPIDEPNSDDFDAHGIKIGYQLPWFAITSMTSHIKAVSTSNLALTNFSVTPPVATPLYTNLEGNVLAEEIVLTSAHGGPWRWSLGGIYRDAEDQLLQSIQGATFSDREESSESFAVYGEATLAFLQGKFELTGGMRYFEDKVAVEDRPTGLTPSDVFKKTSPRAVLAWLPNDALRVYASYAEGFRSGVQQQSTVLPFGIPAADPDTLTTYELGAKGSLWGGGADFEAALYYIDWEDLQQSLIVSVVLGGFPAQTLATINGDSASGLGFDFALTTQPADRLTLGATFSWNDLAFDTDVISRGALFAAKGDRLTYSPEYNYGVFGRYGIPLGASGFAGEFAVSASRMSEQLTRAITGETASSDSITFTQASFLIRAPKRWSAMLFVDNLINEDGNLGPALGRPMTPDDGEPYWNAHLRPRTIGLQVDYHFD